jgi:hypothetical protein
MLDPFQCKDWKMGNERACRHPSSPEYCTFCVHKHNFGENGFEVVESAVFQT